MSQASASPGKRDVTGVLLLDKPQGLTSNQALQRVKRLFAARKAGHTGSLDPIATGMLPLCLGEATKLSAYLLKAEKHYRVTARIGLKTDTGDATGATVLERPSERLRRAELEAVLERFTGEVEQVPPMYSALKHKGRRLYKLAARAARWSGPRGGYGFAVLRLRSTPRPRRCSPCAAAAEFMFER